MRGSRVDAPVLLALGLNDLVDRLFGGIGLDLGLHFGTGPAGKETGFKVFRYGLPKAVVVSCAGSLDMEFRKIGKGSNNTSVVVCIYICICRVREVAGFSRNSCRVFRQAVAGFSRNSCRVFRQVRLTDFPAICG